ncbi:MAG: DUF368 domain-containing protein [SAR86 cluster bacterium]|uniref:DUF368 domain-containing protein n=1 Tax=SAR86 cluster bacterium TaxID=2030880 RepID=A0A2A5B4E9_9GAMM|nr:MAG: DUF368 domain-containing protein [SAR86 cluster bacterium]
MSDSAGNNGNINRNIAESSSESARSKWALYLKGMAMGLGDSVPGVSGGTIAIITNIYDKLVFSIKSVDLLACKLLFAGRFLDMWRHVNGTFLLILFLGVLSGLLISANTVLFLLANYYAPLMSFFIGLVLASCWLLKGEFNGKKWQNVFMLCLGALFAIGVGLLNPRSGEMTYLYVFFSGVIAISAMILPGLSGAFILLLLGVYEFILSALISFDWPYILVFVTGCVIGLLAFSRILAWLLLKHHQLSYGFITGMLLGSITSLWPWQRTISFYTDRSGEVHGLRTANILPQNYTELTGQEPMLAVAILSIVFGAVLVVLLHWVFNTRFQDKAD